MLGVGNILFLFSVVSDFSTKSGQISSPLIIDLETMACEIAAHFVHHALKTIQELWTLAIA